jgi:hypothetical protein
MRNPRPLELKVGVVVAAIAATLSAALLVDAFSGAALARVKQAWAEGGTVHARFYSSGGDLVAEEWLDLESGKSRRVQAGGEEGDEITVQDGKRAVTWNSRGLGDVYEAVVFDPSDPWLVRSSSLLRFKRLVQRGDVRIVGTRSTGGTEAIVVRTESGPDEPSADVEVVLDGATLLPIEATATDADGPSTFRVVSERLAAAPTDNFYAPERKATVVDRRLRSPDLRSLPFDAYTLASPPPDFSLRALGVREQTNADAPFKPEPHLFVGYRPSSGVGDPAFELVERAWGTDQARAELAAFAEAEVRPISVGGRAVEVYVLGEEPIEFALTLRGTLISGYADLPLDETLAALASLTEAS